jgi:hypothetical protein
MNPRVLLLLTLCQFPLLSAGLPEKPTAPDSPVQRILARLEALSEGKFLELGGWSFHLHPTGSFEIRF